MRFVAWLCVALGLLSLWGTAAAQRRIDIERFRPALDADGFLGMQGTRPPASLAVDVGLSLSYAMDPFLARGEGGAEVDVVKHRLGGDFFAQIGLGGRFALAIDVPLVLYQDAVPGPLRDGGPAIATTALSDPRLVLRYRLVGDPTNQRVERGEGFGLALLAAGSAPIGDESAFASERGVTGDLQAIADFHVLGLGAGLMLGVRHRFAPEDVLGTRFRDEIVMGFGLKVPIPVMPRLAGIFEIRGATDAESPFGDQARTAFEADLGARLGVNDLTLTAAVGTGMSGGVGTPAFRGLFSIQWAPKEHDADGDGVPDDIDQCMLSPEDFDEFEDDDGCEDPDNDDDFVFDADDACVNEPAEEGRDEDEDGCTDQVVDRDQDGIEDGADACPEAAEDHDEHQDEDGCPEADNDADGVLDADDRCPDALEDLDRFEDRDGCPDPDNDGDGVLDAADQCPRQPEDMDGHDDEDGCPDLDDDRDGVADASDACPTDAEVVNGVRDDDGCPDRGGRSRVRVTGGVDDAEQRLEATMRLANGALPPPSLPVLDQLAQHLRARAPHHFRVAFPPCPEPTAGADGAVPATCAVLLRRELRTRGVPRRRLTIEPDATLRAGTLVCTRVVEAAPEPHTETPEPEGDADPATETGTPPAPLPTPDAATPTTP